MFSPPPSAGVQGFTVNYLANLPRIRNDIDRDRIKFTNVLKSIWKNWTGWSRGHDGAFLSLDSLASSASPQDSLEIRLNWLVDLVQWIRRPGAQPEPQNYSPSQVQTGRLRR